VELGDGQMSNPPESTRKWLVARQLPDRLPKPFDYDLLVSHDDLLWKGTAVPVVTFRSPNGDGFAKVYIFRHDGRFDLKGIQEAQASRVTAEVIPDEQNRVTYVIVHTGGPHGLRQFLTTRHGGPAI
jgi:hypothetical protein